MPDAGLSDGSEILSALAKVLLNIITGVDPKQSGQLIVFQEDASDGMINITMAVDIGDRKLYEGELTFEKEGVRAIAEEKPVAAQDTMPPVASAAVAAMPAAIPPAMPAAVPAARESGKQPMMNAFKKVMRVKSPLQTVPPVVGEQSPTGEFQQTNPLFEQKAKGPVEQKAIPRTVENIKKNLTQIQLGLKQNPYTLNNALQKQINTLRAEFNAQKQPSKNLTARFDYLKKIELMNKANNIITDIVTDILHTNKLINLTNSELNDIYKLIASLYNIRRDNKLLYISESENDLKTRINNLESISKKLDSISTKTLSTDKPISIKKPELKPLVDNLKSYLQTIETDDLLEEAKRDVALAHIINLYIDRTGYPPPADIGNKKLKSIVNDLKLIGDAQQSLKRESESRSQAAAAAPESEDESEAEAKEMPSQAAPAAPAGKTLYQAAAAAAPPFSTIHSSNQQHVSGRRIIPGSSYVRGKRPQIGKVAKAARVLQQGRPNIGDYSNSDTE